MKFTEKYFEKFLWNSRFMVLTAKNLKQKIKAAIAQHDKSLNILIGVVGQPQAKKQHTTPLLDDYTFENLVLGNANQIAYGAIQQIWLNPDTELPHWYSIF
jgi:chromosomal replication initiator protein